MSMTDRDGARAASSHRAPLSRDTSRAVNAPIQPIATAHFARVLTRLVEGEMPTATRPSLLRRFDDIRGYRLPRWNVLWIEGKLDCRTWTYYCDIRGAMAAMHRVVRQREAVVTATGACEYNESEFDLIVVGPRYSGYVFRDSEPLGISRAQLAKVPLIVLQNKMYESHGEYTGDVRSKLQWAANLGAAAAFTWIGASAAHNFSRRSGVPHHWMPFGVNEQLYGSFAGNFSHQVCKPRKSCHKYCSTTH